MPKALIKHYQSIDSEKQESIIMGEMNVNYFIEMTIKQLKIFLQTMDLSKYLIPQHALLIKPPH